MHPAWKITGLIESNRQRDEEKACADLSTNTFIVLCIHPAVCLAKPRG